jgi:ferredoxin
VVINPEGDDPDTILEAAESCPVEAIILYDAETGAKVWPED